jgi:hypothetical protein
MRVRDRSPRGSPPARWPLTLAAHLLLGCNNEIRAIERLEQPPMAADVRGRVRVSGAGLLSDKNTRLRGATFGVDFEPTYSFDESLFAALTRENGLNAFHVYLENHGTPTGANAAQGDALVDLTERAGMYLILGFGSGDAIGSFDLDQVRAFWSYYAPRYASRTHVLYEIQNAPEPGCATVFSPGTIAMEREIYGLIRAAAPSTHVVLLSWGKIPDLVALSGTLDGLAGVVDWSNASIGYHASEDCVPIADLPKIVGTASGRGTATLVTEVVSQAALQKVAAMEAAHVGWINFDWLVYRRDLSEFRAEHDAAGVTWCADFGVWPEPADSCRDR